MPFSCQHSGCDFTFESNFTFCPTCGTRQLETTGEFVESVQSKQKSFKFGKEAWIISSLLVAAVISGGSWFALIEVPRQQAEEIRAAAEASAEAERLAAEEQEELERQAALEEERRKNEIASRWSKIAGLEADIELRIDALQKSGSFPGYLNFTTCEPSSMNEIEDLDLQEGDFECFVTLRILDNGLSSGTFVSATIDWNDGSYNWVVDPFNSR